MTAPATIRVLIADDHPVVRNGLSALIGTLPGCEVVAEAADGEAAVREAHLVHPDVVIMDVQMPVLDGIEATRRISAALPDVAVLMLTMFEDDDTVFAAMRAGARGFLLKGAEQGEIERALRAVVSGEAIFGPGVASRVLRFFAQPVRAEAPFPELTAREREVLDLIASGSRNSAIAHALGLSPKTVGNHVSSIFAKLAVADRSAAIVRAREGGLGGESRQPRNASGAGHGSR
ncbi:MAG: LuxR family transcriptional regulator [Pseudonocardiales bacterium]|nr:LuxR family transcriptional regulator [Jatrophihabitantaceae bacterium]MCW2602204.1 LuxR family transcriptional regulator [Pseudonocardiales bacterium]